MTKGKRQGGQRNKARKLQQCRKVFLKEIRQDLKELVSEWGVAKVAIVLPLTVTLFVVETFISEPLVDKWYVGGEDSHLHRARRWALVAAEVWTVSIYASVYGMPF